MALEEYDLPRAEEMISLKPLRYLCVLCVSAVIVGQHTANR
jgi:hypothetical protein